MTLTERVVMRSDADIGRIASVLASERSKKSKRIINDILYYLRRLLKLARMAQQISLLEGTNSITNIELELSSIKEEVDRIDREIHTK